MLEVEASAKAMSRAEPCLIRKARVAGVDGQEWGYQHMRSDRQAVVIFMVLLL